MSISSSMCGVEVGARQPGQDGERAEVVDARHGRVERRTLDQRADAVEVAAALTDRRAEDRGRAARRLHQPEQHRHDRRLAGAVRADQPGHRAGRHAERDVVDGGAGAVSLRQPVDDDGIGHRDGCGRPVSIQRRRGGGECCCHDSTVRLRRPRVVGLAWSSRVRQVLRSGRLACREFSGMEARPLR